MQARLKKGLTILLPALALVARHLAKSGQPAPTLFLIGGIRPNEADILDVFRAKQPHLTVQVVPYTNPDQLPSLYGLLDILVLPSLRDGLPNALLEGMACERAEIASNIGGIPEVIRPGENGLLVSPGDVDGLAQAVIALLLAPNRRASLGRAARQTVLQHFTPAGELQANLALYHHLKDKTGKVWPPAGAPVARTQNREARAAARTSIAQGGDGFGLRFRKKLAPRRNVRTGKEDVSWLFSWASR